MRVLAAHIIVDEIPFYLEKKGDYSGNLSLRDL
jgi:hypothetical protein